MDLESKLMHFDELMPSERDDALRACSYQIAILRRNIGRAQAAEREFDKLVDQLTPSLSYAVAAVGRFESHTRALALQAVGGLPSKKAFDVTVSALSDPDGIVSRAAHVALFRLSETLSPLKAHRLIRASFKSSIKERSDFSSLLEKCGGSIPLSKWPMWRFGMNSDKASTYFGEGERLRSKGNHRAAAQQYRWSIYRSPYDRAAWLSLGETNFALNLTDDGLEQLQFGCLLAPQEPQSSIRYIKALKAVGIFAQAQSVSETLLRLPLTDETRNAVIQARDA